MNKKPRKPDIGSELIAGMANALRHNPLPP